jgi:hypothetical protein
MRRPRAWGQPCPQAKGPLFKLMDRGHVSAISTDMTESGKRRIFRCQRGETTVSETRDTVFFDLRTSEEKVLMALKMLLVWVARSGLACVLGVHEETVLAWLVRAAANAHELNAHVRRDLPGTQVPLDARWNCMARQHARETDEAGESVPEGEDGRPWVWGSLAPECRLMSAAGVGPRTLDTATEVVAVTKARVAGISACFSDGFTGDLAALIAAFHVVTTCASTGTRGRPRQPVWEPPPDLVYAPWVKQKTQGTRRTRSTRVVLGAERLTQRRLTLSPAWVERVHLTLRQALAPLARKTSSVGKDRERMRQRVVFFQAFYQVARPHLSWRRQVPRRARHRHGAIRPRWRERTPAMAAGLTDHVWTFRELLTAKFAPLDSQSISR